MLALMLALASADPSLAAQTPTDVTTHVSTDVTDAARAAPSWRAVAFADPVTGALGIEAPLGALYAGVGAFAGGSRNHHSLDGAAFGGGPITQDGGTLNGGVAAWLQGRFLALRVVDVSWVMRGRGGYADASFSDGGNGLGATESTSIFASVAACLVADARIVDGVALRVGVDVAEVGARMSEHSNAGFSSAGDDLELAFLLPQAGLVIDLF